VHPAEPAPEPDGSIGEQLARAERLAVAGRWQAARSLLELCLSSGADPATRVACLITLGRAEAALGIGTAADRWRAAVIDSEQLPAAEVIEALADVGEAYYAAGHVGEARTCFERAWQRLGGDDPADDVDHFTRARVAAGLSTTSLFTGRRHVGVTRMLDDAIARAPSAPTLAERAVMASAAGEAALGVDRQVAVIHRLVDAAIGQSPLSVAIHRPAIEAVAAALSLTGRPHDAIALLDPAIERAALEHDLVASASLLPLRAHAHYCAGALRPAGLDAEATLTLLGEYPTASALAGAPARYVLARVALDRGDRAAAEAAVDVADHWAAWGDTPMHGWFLDALGRVRLSTGDSAAAIAAFRDAGRAFTLVGGSGTLTRWRDGLAAALVSCGELDEATDVAQSQLDAAIELGSTGSAMTAEAVLATIEPDHAVAAERLRSALALVDADDEVLERCRVTVELGRRLRRCGARRAARDQLDNARVIATRLGADGIARDAGAELDAAGARSARGGGDATALTAAEAMTAELAADGLTNAEIARIRRVSRKTVEAQLSSCYRKSGCGDRSALRAWLGRR
jgi:DNA-binding CsgD family transcriptional regulator